MSRKQQAKSAANQFASKQDSFFERWLTSPHLKDDTKANERTFFGLVASYNVVRYLMTAEAIFLLPVALGHCLVPSMSLSPMLRKGVEVDDVGAMIVRWYGCSCFAIAVFGILAGQSGQGLLSHVVRKFFYSYQLIGEGLIVPLFFLFIHKYGEWNFSSVNYVFGTILFSTLRIVALTMHNEWFGLKDVGSRR